MDTAIQKASKRQDYVLSDEDALRIYEMRQKAHWDLISSTNSAREERSHEIARKALAEGATVEFVLKITGLEPEVIKKL